MSLLKCTCHFFDNVSNISLILYIVGKQVYHWYIGRRTIYGKLTTDKSGDGVRVYTDRKLWTLDNFYFLHVNISMLTRFNISNVSIKT